MPRWTSVGAVDISRQPETARRRHIVRLIRAAITPAIRHASTTVCGMTRVPPTRMTLSASSDNGKCSGAMARGIHSPPAAIISSFHLIFDL
jgi:hypothetical protein